MARSWLAFSAVGAGLIHLALVIGSPAASGVFFALVGVIEFGWGLIAVATSRIFTPRFAMAVALVPALFWVVAIFAASALRLPQLASSLRVLPLLIATLLEFFVAGAIAVSLRRAGRVAVAAHTGVAAASDRSSTRQLVAIAAGILVVAALTAPALAATQVGELAVPAGTFDEHGGH